MAIVKVVSSKASITNAIDYVTKKEKTNGKLVSGYNLNAKYAKEQMAITKKIWDKTGGRTYKHFVQSYHKDEKIDLEKAHELAYQFVERAELFKDFEVLIATHSDKEHIHTHFIVNSVNASTGKKFQMKKTDLDVLRNISDEICRKNGLTITKDGKSFEGEKRVSISAPTKETYRQLKKASEKKATSYIENIAKAIIELKEIAKSKIEFIELMKNKGFEVLWSDNKKNVTYVDIARKKAGEIKYKVRDSRLEKYYNMAFGKSLELCFEKNRKEVNIDGDLSIIDRLKEKYVDFKQKKAEFRGHNTESIENVSSDIKIAKMDDFISESDNESKLEAFYMNYASDECNKERNKKRVISGLITQIETIEPREEIGEYDKVILVTLSEMDKIGKKEYILQAQGDQGQKLLELGKDKNISLIAEPRFIDLKGINGEEVSCEKYLVRMIDENGEIGREVEQLLTDYSSGKIDTIYQEDDIESEHSSFNPIERAIERATREIKHKENDRSISKDDDMEIER